MNYQEIRKQLRIFQFHKDKSKQKNLSTNIEILNVLAINRYGEILLIKEVLLFSVSSTGSGGGAGIGGEALVGFHEDAISQAAVGRAQLLLTLVLGLGLAAECSELSILGFILPSAELQLCIDEHRKGWLGE